MRVKKEEYRARKSIFDIRFDKLGYLLNECALAIKQETTIALEPHSIGPREAGVLIYLSNAGPIVQQKLAELTNIDRTTTMKIMVTLEKNGIINRKRDPSDTRAYIIRLTTKGQKTAKAVNQIINKVQNDFLKALSKYDAKVLINSLGTILEDYRYGKGDRLESTQTILKERLRYKESV